MYVIQGTLFCNSADLDQKSVSFMHMCNAFLNYVLSF